MTIRDCSPTVHPGASAPQLKSKRSVTSWCVIALETWMSDRGVLSVGGVAVGDEAGDGPIGGGQVLPAVGPADQLLPTFVIGEGVFDGDAPQGVSVPGS